MSDFSIPYEYTAKHRAYENNKNRQLHQLKDNVLMKKGILMTNIFKKSRRIIWENLNVEVKIVSATFSARCSVKN